jgi:hypothetical protein
VQPWTPCLCVLKHVLGYHSHTNYAGFQMLKIIVFDLVYEVRNYFTYMMPGGWFGKGTPIAWSLRLPNLTPLDCRHSIPYVNTLYTWLKNMNFSSWKPTYGMLCLQCLITCLKTCGQILNIFWLFVVLLVVPKLKSSRNLVRSEKKEKFWKCCFVVV